MPAIFRRLDNPRTLRAQIAEHDVWPAHEQPSAIVDAFHIIDPRFDARQQSSDRAGVIASRLIGRENRRGFSDAVTFDEFGRAFAEHQMPCLVAQALSAANSEAKTFEIVMIGDPHILRNERVGREQYGGAMFADTTDNFTRLARCRMQHRAYADIKRHQRTHS